VARSLENILGNIKLTDFGFDFAALIFLISVHMLRRHQELAM
jgi:hypothetical protein